MTDLVRFLLGTVGFFFLIVLPLLFYLKSRAQPVKRIVLYIFVVYVLWYLPYAPIHEGSHFLGGRLSGMHLKSSQFIPPFWKGDFVHGYVTWENGKLWQMLLELPSPLCDRWIHRCTSFSLVLEANSICAVSRRAHSGADSSSLCV